MVMNFMIYKPVQTIFLGKTGNGVVLMFPNTPHKIGSDANVKRSPTFICHDINVTVKIVHALQSVPRRPPILSTIVSFGYTISLDSSEALCSKI
jgi:hypothetical protein